MSDSSRFSDTFVVSLPKSSSLKKLNISQLQLSEYDLTTHTQLEELTLRFFGEQTNVVTLPDSSAMEEITIGGLDIDSIPTYLNLKKLVIQSLVSNGDIAPINALKDLSPLAGSRMLQTLWLDINQQIDANYLAPLNNLEALLDLTLSGIESPPSVSFSAISNLSNLHFLQLLGGTLEDLTFVRELTNLRSLNIIGSEISDLSPLVNLSKLEHLNIGARRAGTPNTTAKRSENANEAVLISDISVVANFPKLKV